MNLVPKRNEKLIDSRLSLDELEALRELRQKILELSIRDSSHKSAKEFLEEMDRTFAGDRSPEFYLGYLTGLLHVELGSCINHETKTSSYLQTILRLMMAAGVKCYDSAIRKAG